MPRLPPRVWSEDEMNTWLVALYGLDGTVRRKAVRLPLDASEKQCVEQEEMRRDAARKAA